MLKLKTNTFKYKDSDGSMKDVGAIVGEVQADTVLSTTSTNPVQNKVVTEKINEIYDEIDDCLPKNQGAANVGKILVVGTDGKLTLTDMPSSEASEYITETELNAKGYLTSVPSEYITETELNTKGYLTQHQDISGKADKNSAEKWIFTLEDGTTVTKKVVLA